MDPLVPIGRFSAMTRLSIKALRHYDEIGLLRPAAVDDATSYRYYHLGQANDAEAIRALRSLDLPLEEIRDVLAADDPEVAAKTLDIHRRRLADSIEEQRRRLAFISRLITGEASIVPYTVTTTTIADELVAGVRRTTDFASIGGVIQEGFPQLFGAVMTAGGQPTGMPFIVYHDVIDDETDGDIEMCIPIATELDLADDVACRVVPGTTVASVIHTGPYDEIAPAYHVLTSWMSDHGHSPAGPPRERYLDDPTQVAPAELRTEVQWPID